MSDSNELIFSNKQEPEADSVSLDGQPLKRVENFKNLGTVFVPQDSFSDDTECTICSQHLYFLRRLANLGASLQIFRTCEQISC